MVTIFLTGIIFGFGVGWTIRDLTLKRKWTAIFEDWARKHYITTPPACEFHAQPCKIRLPAGNGGHYVTECWLCNPAIADYDQRKRRPF